MERRKSESNPSESPKQLQESRITKLYRNDKATVFFWIVFMWIILASVALKVSTLTEDGSVKIIALVAGGLVGLFNTIALVAVSGHLKQKKNQLYAEDLCHLDKMKETGKSWNLMKVFDVLFILVLCYITLLIPMLMQGKVLVGGSGQGKLVYDVDWRTILLCIFAFAGYMGFLLKQSEKELKVLIDNVYGRKEDSI